MMLVLAALTVAQLAMPAQARPQATPATARISGVVRSAADDKPLPRARVVAVSADQAEPRAAISDAEGHYSIADLSAGAYTVSATRTGFAPFTYGQVRAGAEAAPVTLTAGQQLTTLDLALTPGGVIAGRVLDEDGAPFAGAIVDALIRRSQGGRDGLVVVSTTQTDDRGEFRLFGLPPASYFVSAGDPAFANVGSPKGVLHYSPTYFPGTSAADQAKAVTVGSGEAPRLEFKLQLVPPAEVTGQILTSDGRPLLSGAIVMSGVESSGAPLPPSESPDIFPDGRFGFKGVAPGHYQIRARGQTAALAPTQFASYALDVRGTDITNVRMTLHPGAMLDGTIAFESVRGTRAPELSLLRVRAPFIDGNTFGDSLTGAVQTNGSYVLRGLMQGIHQIVVDGLQPPWVLKSVRYRGNDITDLQLPVENREEFRDVRIVVTDAGSEVTGVVTDQHATPVANTGVLVYAKVPVFWMRTSRRMRMTFTDAAGRWSLAGLPAGEYVAVATPTVDESDLGRRDRLETLASIATPFRLETDEAHARVPLVIRSLASASAVR